MRYLPALAVFAIAAGGCNLLVGIEPWDTSGGSNATSSSAGGATSSSSTDATTTTTTSVASTSSGEGGAPATPRCDDALKNGDESDVDCGGDACSPCSIDAHCGSNADCASLTCMSSVCVAFVAPGCPASPDPANPTCADCAQNGAETAIDCGGDACGPCADGLACLLDADCASGACAANVCGPKTVRCAPVDPDNPVCNDCVQNGGETAIDCGGDACGPCADGLACVTDADCTSGLCAAAVCTPVPPP